MDASQHKEIHGYVPKFTAFEKVMSLTLLPAVKVAAPSMFSPTKELGRVLTELAMGDGEPLSGAGVEGEGRTVTNAGMRRLAGLK